LLILQLKQKQSAAEMITLSDVTLRRVFRCLSCADRLVLTLQLKQKQAEEAAEMMILSHIAFWLLCLVLTDHCLYCS